ncbi:HAD family hydrolase [Paenibacillus sp. 481]|uniref:HAD family hydrolase n=1 Tax=Paenibacillus sp. 481 TaxID=2835869 RepID=UPI001E46A9D2|nr:HAD family hydrolase [Paenibacillus sp. 481]UHA73608.1 HAD family hydrolase [Paenibacillus sp. 481]
MTSTPQQTLLFDLDDTLIYCNKYFYAVVDQFLDTMTTWFKSWNIHEQDIKAIQTELDIAGVQQQGFVSEHFPQSMIDTYRHFSNLTGRATAQEEEELLWKLGMSVYETEVEPYPGMVETLERLRNDGHELYLYTGGQPVIQHRKIEQMQLRIYFGDRIFIRQHKTAAALAAIVEEQGFDRSRTWMIGNSVRTDVVPALMAGLHAIYLKQPNEWAYNLVDIDAQPAGAFATIEQLVDVPDIVRQWTTDRPN